MKAVVLILKLAGGGLKAIAAERSAEILASLPEIRKSGLFKGEPVVAGVVLSTERFSPVAKFNCAPGSAKAKAKG